MHADQMKSFVSDKVEALLGDVGLERRHSTGWRVASLLGAFAAGAFATGALWYFFAPASALPSGLRPIHPNGHRTEEQPENLPLG